MQAIKLVEKDDNWNQEEAICDYFSLDNNSSQHNSAMPQQIANNTWGIKGKKQNVSAHKSTDTPINLVPCG